MLYHVQHRLEKRCTQVEEEGNNCDYFSSQLSRPSDIQSHERPKLSLTPNIQTSEHNSSKRPRYCIPAHVAIQTEHCIPIRAVKDMHTSTLASDKQYIQATTSSSDWRKGHICKSRYPMAIGLNSETA